MRIKINESTSDAFIDILLLFIIIARQNDTDVKIVVQFCIGNDETGRKTFQFIL